MEVFLLAGAFVAGLVDAVVGGGGLIQIPVLFGAYPTGTPATIFGTNKLAGVFGTASAAARYARRVRIPWAIALPASAAAVVGAYCGAMTVSVIPPDVLKPLVLVMLVSVAGYTLLRKDFGSADRDVALERRHVFGAVLVGGVIGFYDGFFGPGTGSFLIFLFVRFFSLDFLRASAAAKIVNVVTNVAALFYFGVSGDVMWCVGLTMAAFNMVGALVGAQLALRHGSRFVRWLFLAIVFVLIVRFALEVVR